MTSGRNDLYSKLPAIYRVRDAENGYKLRALLSVIEEQADILDEDISRMYENWFIETCEDWVVPYIGDLLGYLPLHNTGMPAGRRSARDADRTRILIPRRDVANTIRYRRRKGTLALLELLAGDVADWPARAVEFYRVLGWTQAISHLHPGRGRTTDIHDVDILDRVDGPFDETAHTVDVRRIVSGRTPGRYNIPEAGVFACRLQSYPVTMTMAHHHDTVRRKPDQKKKPVHGNYTFSILGNDAPLYTRPERETDPRHIAEEINLPVPIRRRALEDRAGKKKEHRYRTVSPVYYGPEKSLAIWVLGWPPTRESMKGPPQLIPADRVIVADLSEWKYDIPKQYVAVDPVLGRIRFPAAARHPSRVFVRYHYGFSADIGGGEYSRPIPGPDLKHISGLHARDLKNTEQFAAKLAAAEEGTDPVSGYILGRLSDDTKKELTITGSPELAVLLARDLTALLADQAFYSPERFGNIAMDSAELLGLLDQKPGSDGTVRRNRLLLEAAYPQFIPRSFLMYRVGTGQEYTEIPDAISAWYNDGPVHAVIEITDSGVYSNTRPISITLEPYQSLYVRAADAKRPVIRLLDLEPSAADFFSISGGEGSRLVLDGLLITGRGIRISGPENAKGVGGSTEDLCEVVIRHCTLVPGWSIDSGSCPEYGGEPSIELERTRTQLYIEKSITGSITVAADAVRAEPNRIRIRDSIVDATRSHLDAISTPEYSIAHAALSFERCTVIGNVSVHSIRHAENSIFTGEMMVARTQEGCMRFCYVPDGSRTPRKYQCMPDSLIAEPGKTDEEKAADLQRVRPSFTSRCYGKPGYCQLAIDCPMEIREGAEDESEMGVFHDLYQPQREANLRLRLVEYTPAGMESGIIFVN